MNSNDRADAIAAAADLNARRSEWVCANPDTRGPFPQANPPAPRVTPSDMSGARFDGDTRGAPRIDMMWLLPSGWRILSDGKRWFGYAPYAVFHACSWDELPSNAVEVNAPPTTLSDLGFKARPAPSSLESVQGKPYMFGGGVVGDNSGSVRRANMRSLPARMREAAETLREANRRAMPDAVPSREDVWSAGGLEQRADKWDAEDNEQAEKRRALEGKAVDAIVELINVASVAENLDAGDELDVQTATTIATMLANDYSTIDALIAYRETTR